MEEVDKEFVKDLDLGGRGTVKVGFGDADFSSVGKVCSNLGGRLF